MADISNIILDSGGPNQITVLTTDVKETLIKKLTIIVPPQSSANWDSGPKTTKIVDLLKIEERFTITGLIETVDKNKAKNIFKAGGTVVMNWEDEDFNVNLEKLEVGKGSDEQTERPITFTCVIGVNI